MSRELLAKIWTEPPHQPVVVSGPKASTQYAQQRKYTVPTGQAILIFDENSRAQYRLVQVTGADAAKLIFANVAKTSDDGLVLNAGDAYEMASIFGNLFLGKIFAIAAGASNTEVTIFEIGNAGE
ncbi:MAG TPA: hypothetical protein VNO22_02875 [Planctomycetota bacterium]|nr:hypothetical protein [Planctomycetota bacterium]